MNNTIRRALIIILLVSIISGIAHYLFIKYGLPEQFKSNSYWLIYLFIVPTTIVGYVFVANKVMKDPHSGGKNAMGFSIAKMIASLLFLSPWLIYKTEMSKPFALQFMLLYFIFLTTETVLFIKLINSSNKKD